MLVEYKKLPQPAAAIAAQPLARKDRSCAR
jgi:hypothetical protein